MSPQIIFGSRNWHFNFWEEFLSFSPNSVYTEGVLAVILGLADLCCASRTLFCHQLLCAGAVLGACCLTLVQARRSVTPLSPEKHYGFSTLFLSGQKVILLPPGGSLVAPEGPGMSLQGSLEVPPEPWSPSSRVLPPGFLLWDSSSSNPSWRFLLRDSSPRIPLLELFLEDSSSRILLSGFLLQDFSCWIPVLVFLFQDSSSRIPPPGFPFLDYSSRIPLLGFLL